MKQVKNAQLSAASRSLERAATAISPLVDFKAKGKDISKENKEVQHILSEIGSLKKRINNLKRS